MSALAEVSMQFCAVDGCPNAAQKGGLCYGHRKRKQRGGPVSTALKQRPKSPLERLTEAAITYAEADGDEDYARARENLRKSSVAYAPSARAEIISQLTREALAKLKAQGVTLGRPQKEVDHAQLVLEAESASARAVAAKLGVSVRTVWRALKRARARVRKHGNTPVP